MHKYNVDDEQFHILVAEDNPGVQCLIHALLVKYNCLPTLVSNGRDAVQALLRNQTYDLVLMDVQMPIMDGLAAARVIRMLRDPVDKIPIIALTADTERAAGQAALGAGMNDYLAKPIEIPAFAQAITYWGNYSRAWRRGPKQPRLTTG